MDQKTNLILIEDNKSFRRVLKMAMQDDDQLHILSEFGTAEIALREVISMTTQPDLILLDLSLPGISGLEAIPYLIKLCPKSKIIILSQSNAEADILRAIVQGAAGYLLKTSDIVEIIENIKKVAQGGAILDHTVAKHLMDLIKKKSSLEKAVMPLSERELSILTLLAEGYQKKEIAEKLNISYSTVDTHVSKIYDKLNVNNAPAAVGIAYRLGILT